MSGKSQPSEDSVNSLPNNARSFWYKLVHGKRYTSTAPTSEAINQDLSRLEAGFSQSGVPDITISDLDSHLDEHKQEAQTVASISAPMKRSIAGSLSDFSPAGHLSDPPSPTSYSLPQQEDQDTTSRNDDESQKGCEKTYFVNQADDTANPPEYTAEAQRLVHTFTAPNRGSLQSDLKLDGTHTPAIQTYILDIDYVPPPKQYKPSIFGALLTSKLNELDDHARQLDMSHALSLEVEKAKIAKKQPRHQRSHSYNASPSNSGTTTPSKKIRWYDKPEHHSAVASMLVQTGISSTSPGVPATSGAMVQTKMPGFKSQSMISTAVDIIQGTHGRNMRTTPRYDVVAEVADILARRRYLTKLCGAFMMYGAPTHRLEEYLTASARALAIESDFLYIPGAMMCTFIDNTIHANTVEIVRKPTGLDFGRLKDVFDVYKCVIHDKYTAEEAIQEIENIQKRPDGYGVWFRIFMFGIASVVVSPFSFSARPVDFVPIFFLGSALGFMQLKIVPLSEQFSNVFEIFACLLTAFIARGLGSIRGSDGQYIFCFSATAQSSIAMILPGFLVLNSALELQSRNIVSGSVRMVYAIIYVLFLGFGLLIGTTIFGLIKRDAVNEVTCALPDWFSPAGNHWKLLYTRFIWAPLFACALAIVYQAKWRQLPVMAFLALCGHQANFWISTQLSSNLQVANAIGAFAIGCLANLYSRIFHGLAATAMLPAIYCQVPGGLAASGSLVAGVDYSNQIFGNSSAIGVINNGTQGFVTAQENPSSLYGGTIYNVGYGMVQVSIGISVGLYLSALVVYPYGKKRSKGGIFSF